MKNMVFRPINMVFLDKHGFSIRKTMFFKINPAFRFEKHSYFDKPCLSLDKPCFSNTMAIEFEKHGFSIEKHGLSKITMLFESKSIVLF
jgi:hypothetical protein